MAPSALGLDRRQSRLRTLATAVLVVGIPACVAVAVVGARVDRAGHSSLTIVLALAAVASGVMVVDLGGGASISASFVVILLAAAFLGPASACAAAVLAEVAATCRIRITRRYAFASNVFAGMVSALASGELIRVLARHGPSKTAGFYLVIAAAGALCLALSFVVAVAYNQVMNGRVTLTFATFKELAPSQALNVVIAVAGAAIYLKLGLAGISFALVAIFAFSYMAQLVQRARHRSEQYVSLSWGVLAGLMRALDIRDQRAGRHAAAVARFARDLARAVGMTPQECELAHTAGLLHDIGRFALSDRVAERGRTLTEEDWMAIHRHPELGAEILRDLGMYGPVGEIILAHHERIDGRGYPRGLAEEEIPEIAKILSVAEVYDTLTASDTYRTRMSSFEALTELRRVAGSQVDARYVEVLAGLLTGEGVEYRHADMADFDVELDMERRIKEAGAGA
jgi:putative nucleotidyltransferase with HDIG domain